MGVGFQKRSFYTNSNIDVAPNPNPGSYRVIKVLKYSRAHVVIAHYIGCTNFEGNKVMVYQGPYREMGVRDPHFQEHEYSPVARFPPTELGIKLAIQTAQSL